MGIVLENIPSFHARKQKFWNLRERCGHWETFPNFEKVACAGCSCSSEDLGSRVGCRESEEFQNQGLRATRGLGRLKNRALC